MLNRKTETTRNEQPPSERPGGYLAIFWRTFIRDNRVIPPILAVVALLVFSWVVAGSFLGGTDETATGDQNAAAPPEPSGSGAEVAQSEDPSTPAEEMENPNAESFAAYESKDPFRSLFTPATADTGVTDDTGGGADGGETTENGNGNNGNGNNGNNNGGNGNNGGSNRNPADNDGSDSDNDGARTDPTRSPAENQYDRGQQDNQNAGGSGNTGGSGSNGGGGNTGGGGGGGNTGGGSGGGSGGGGSGGSGSGGSGDLFDSGGDLPDYAR